MENSNKSVTFVYGSDDFLVDRRARSVFDEKSGGCGEIFTFEKPSDSVQTFTSAITALATVPLFNDGNTIWLRAMNFSADPASSEGERSLVASLLESVKSANDKEVIISANNVDKRTKFFKEVVQVAKAVDIDGSGPTAEEFEVIIREIANFNGVKIGGDAVELLMMKCGHNGRLLEQEVNKLATYVLGHGDLISVGDVYMLVDDGNTGNFFEPVEKFFFCDIGEVLDAIGRYFFFNNDARPLVAALQSKNRLMIQLRALIDAKKIRIVGGNIPRNDLLNVAKILHMENLNKTSFNVFSQNPWYLSKLATACFRFELKKLLQFQTMFTAVFFEFMGDHREQTAIVKDLAIKCLCQK
ncbi:MAG: hypothetical protein LBR91_03775 [Puniceicoccales bacterium]|jgi:DNA polymerase-3 subunit delta|nr:hypothetical protein [Puniceicoccales bacterium]